MKKLLYFLALAATLSMSSSCKDKKDKDDEDDMEDMTLVVSGADQCLA